VTKSPGRQVDRVLHRLASRDALVSCAAADVDVNGTANDEIRTKAANLMAHLSVVHSRAMEGFKS
jgi:hypothetical protein